MSQSENADPSLNLDNLENPPGDAVASENRQRLVTMLRSLNAGDADAL